MPDTTLEAALAHLSQQLSELEEREQAGEDVKAEKEELEAKRDELAAATPEEDEPTRLRNELALYQKREMAKSIAAEIHKSTIEAQAKESQELSEMVRKEVANLMGGGDMESVVRGVMKNVRQGSRFAGQGASQDFVEHLAAGGTARTVPNGMSEVRVGEPRGAKAEAKDIFESKSIGRLFSIIARAKSSGGMFLSDGEKEFVRTYSMGLRYGEKAPPMAEGTDSAGGYLVPQQWMPDILAMLRAQAIVRRANPRIIPFNKQMNQTSISTGATAGYTLENQRIAPSDITFAEAPLLTPKNLTALIPVSNYLLNDANAADGLIRDELVEVVALKEDISFLRADGTGGAPLGLRNKVGIQLNPITVPANGFQPTLADLRRVRAVFRNRNAGAVRLAWFFHPAFLSYLETRTDTEGRFLLDTNLLRMNDDGSSGVIDGVPFFTSTQIPTNLTQGSSTNATDLMLVNMAETIVGENQSLELAVSDEASWTSDGTNWNSAFQQNQTLFRAVIRHDIAHRRPADGIIVQTGVLV